MLRTMAPRKRRRVVCYFSHTLLRKGLEHDAKDGFGPVFLIHGAPPIEIGAHRWYVVLLHVSGIEVFDGETRPALGCAEDIVQAVVGRPWESIPRRCLGVFPYRRYRVEAFDERFRFFLRSRVHQIDV